MKHSEDATMSGQSGRQNQQENLLQSYLDPSSGPHMFQDIQTLPNNGLAVL